MHYPHLKKDLVGVHVWRQTQTQTTINNFFEEDMNILNPRINNRDNTDGIFRMEFPLMQWLTACMYQVFGNSILITRIFMFLIGLLSVLGMYFLINSIFNNKNTALIAAWAFNFSPCFYYYTINPLPDNMALCFSIWGAAAFFYWVKNQNIRLLLISGLFISIAALCKLPFILFFSIPFFYFLIQLRKKQKITSLFLNAFMVLFWCVLSLSLYINGIFK